MSLDFKIWEKLWPMTAFGLQCVYGGVISDLRGTVQQGDGWREAVSGGKKE